MKDFLDPNQVLDQIELSSEMLVADFGSGSGGWAIPLAKRLKDGKVFAIDVLKDPLSALKSRAESERILNIQTVCSSVESKEGLKLANNSLDLILMTNLLFQVEDKKKVFSEAKRILKPGGKILVVDWLSKSPLGPEKGRVSPEEVKKIAKDNGLNFEKEFKAGFHHYGLIFKKT